MTVDFNRRASVGRLPAQHKRAVLERGGTGRDRPGSSLRFGRDDKEWADIIFVTERAQRAKLQRRFRAQLKRARVICLDIPDDYAFMQPELEALLEKKVGPHIRSFSP